jgi:regulator of sigma E protease
MPWGHDLRGRACAWPGRRWKRLQAPRPCSMPPTRWPWRAVSGAAHPLRPDEGTVPPEEAHLAFNSRPLRHRAAIVAAGPLANLLLAVLLYSVVNWIGVQEPEPVLASPVAGSIAEKAGLRGGEWVRQGGLAGGDSDPVRSFESLRWLLTRGALDGHDVRLTVASSRDGVGRDVILLLGSMDASEADARLFQRIGIVAPWTEPLIGDILPKSPASRAGPGTCRCSPCA